MSKRVFVFGIDSATLDIIVPEVKKGNLKNFGRLLKDGSWGELRSTAISNSSVAWTSFMTGKNPGRHGINNFFSVDKERLKFISFSDIEDRPFWDILADRGKKSYLINCPLTYPPKVKDGVMVSGFQTPLDKKDFVYPEDFWSDIKRVSPGYKVYPSTNIKKDLRGHIEEIDSVLKSQLDLVMYVFKEKKWDTLVYVMQNIDALQHFLWRYIDKNHSRYRYDEFFSKALFRFYNILDDFLGKLMDAMDDDTYLMVMSDHGVGKSEKEFFLNNWLLKNGYLFLKNRPSTNFKKFLMGMGLCEADFYNFFVAHNPLVKLVNFLTGSKNRGSKSRTFYTLKDIDWEKTRAHAINVNQVYITSGSRDHEGLRDELVAKLKKIKHPYKKGFLISEIYKREDVFFGEKLSQMPDIIYTCDNGEIVSPGGDKATSPRIFDKTCWSGDHRPNGILFCYGRCIKKGFKIENARIVDVASTVIALLLGVVPEDFDGKVLEEIFEPGILGDVKRESISTKKIERGRSYTDSQQEQVKKTLESLGYL